LNRFWLSALHHLIRPGLERFTERCERFNGAFDELFDGSQQLWDELAALSGRSMFREHELNQPLFEVVNSLKPGVRFKVLPQDNLLP
jgi:hypothetical protein